MAYNILSGTVIAPEYFGPPADPSKTLTNVISGSLGKSDGQSIKNVPRVSNATNDGLVTNVGGDANTLRAESNLTFDSSTNVLSLTGEMTASTGISASYFQGDGSMLMNVGASLAVKTGSSTVSDVSTINTSMLGLVQNLGSGEIAITGTIGEPEDGSYADGLFTEFNSKTPIGTAIDKLNEILKIIAPSPAPSVQTINYKTPAGTTTKLSFGPSNNVAEYANVLSTAGIGSAVSRNGTYQPAVAGGNTRIGVFDGTQDVTGTINYNVNYNYTNGVLNYASGAFGNAELGTLKLKLNGAEYHTLALDGSDPGTGLPATGSGTSLTNNSGFTHISLSGSGFDGNGAEWYTFQHRTARYKVAATDMVPGWNYVQVVHTVGSTDYTTNYIEWLNDPSGSENDLATDRQRIDDISLVGSKYLSGVQYNTNATANYMVDLLNMYRNVFAASGNPVSFTVNNSSTPAAQSVPDLGVGDDNTRILRITASLNVNASVDNLLDGAITADVTATHPLKDTISNAGSATTGDGFLIDNRTLASTNLIEYFHDESYRMVSASYDTQNSVDVGAWNSQSHMISGGPAGHEDGLLFYNQRLYSPKDNDVANNGNFSGMSNVESGQPDYSTASGTRCFYRVLTNSSGADIRDLKITSNKQNTAYSNTTLDNANIRFFIKNPGDTNYMNIRNNFAYGNVGFNAGALINGANDNSNTTGGGPSVHCVTFGTASVANGEYIVIKIEADASWDAYINQLTFQLGASDVSAPTEAPVLDDIDANNSGVSTAKLSFGTSNAVASYSDATGSAIGSTDFNINGLYDLSGDRRGVFDSKQTLVGELNEDIAANGTNYVANAFKDAFSGVLVLEVNGVEVHSTNIHNLNSITDDFNGNDSGFSVSAVSFSETTDYIPDYRKPYRTGTYQIGPSDQNLGWNYARVIHRHGGSDYTTNYVEWVVDTDANSLAAADVSLSNFGHTDIYYQSGIGYFASRPTASYLYRATNAFRNVYQNGSMITFPVTNNCAVTNIRVAGPGIHTTSSAVSALDGPKLNGAAACHTTNMSVTGTIQTDAITSISGSSALFTHVDASVSSRVKHPLKSNLNTAELTKESFMVYSASFGSTNATTAEYFGIERYRIISGNYVNQTDITSSNNIWTSSYSMNDFGTYPDYADGLASANNYLVSPFMLGNDGDTRNVEDGGSLQAPYGNPNYSSLTKATRSYYRHFVNNTGLAKSSFKLKLYGDANLIAKDGAFNTGILADNDNINVELKVSYDSDFPGLDDTSTAWGDAIRPYSAGVQPTADGVGILNLGGTDLNQTVGGSGREIPIQLQASQVRNGQYFVVKISAHKDWTGHLSRIEVDYT